MYSRTFSFITVQWIYVSAAGHKIWGGELGSSGKKRARSHGSQTSASGGRPVRRYILYTRKVIISVESCRYLMIFVTWRKLFYVCPPSFTSNCTTVSDLSSVSSSKIGEYVDGKSAASTIWHWHALAMSKACESLEPDLKCLMTSYDGTASLSLPKPFPLPNVFPNSWTVRDLVPSGQAQEGAADEAIRIHKSCLLKLLSSFVEFGLKFVCS